MRNVLNMSGVIAAALALGLAGGALAAEDPPIATAASAPAPLTSIPGVAAPDPTADQIDAWLKADGSSVQRADPNQTEPLTPAARAIHGEVGATVSNRGYSAYGAASMPIGQASELDVAVAGGHVSYPHGGSSNPQSLAVGLYLDGRDVNNWLSQHNCGVPRWGVALKDDPQVQADGSCKKKTDQASSDRGSGHHRWGLGAGATTTSHDNQPLAAGPVAPAP